ncbi:DUF1499 domain-containing protein [Pseudahrensia aquimaris]|uniref:DUF1499 domain-containing protein n=1 Tax=Pseudahrensia aquimaris TaxID=744461 RepID=A0ABW3FEL3_9HYPH
MIVLRLAKRIAVWSTTVVAVLALIAALGVMIMGWDSIWEKMAGPADQGPVNFATLTKTPKPNQALICPEGFCAAAEAKGQVDRQSPIYALSADQLKQELLRSLETENDLTRVDDESEENRMRFVQRTARLRFPDSIRVEIVPLSNGRSSIALYSQSQIGTSDLGVNAKRMNRWLKRLAQFEAKV